MTDNQDPTNQLSYPRSRSGSAPESTRASGFEPATEWSELKVILTTAHIDSENYSNMSFTLQNNLQTSVSDRPVNASNLLF